MEPREKKIHECMYEALLFGRLTRLFMDLEFYRANNPQLEGRENEMTEMVIRFLVEMTQRLCNVTLEEEDFVVLVADTPTKVSRHVICIRPDFMFRTMLALSWFYSMASGELEERTLEDNEPLKLLRVRDKNEVETWFIDWGTDKDFQLFRTAFARKYRQQNPLLPKPEQNPCQNRKSLRS